MRPDLAVDLDDLEANSALLAAVHDHCFDNGASPLNLAHFDAESTPRLGASAFRAPGDADCAFGATGLGLPAVGAIGSSYSKAVRAFRARLEALEQVTADLERRTRLNLRMYAQVEEDVTAIITQAVQDTGGSRVWE